MIESQKMNELLNSMGMSPLYRDEIKDCWNLIIKEDDGEKVDRAFFSGPKKQLYQFLSNYARNNKNKKMSGILECGSEKESFDMNHGNVFYKLIK